MSDKDNVFIFKFEKKVMGGKTEHTKITEVSKNVYMFEIEALNMEDIILDMRDRITSEFAKVDRRGYMSVNGRSHNLQLSENFIKEIDGKMEFYVRKVMVRGSQNQRASQLGGVDRSQGSLVGGSNDLDWVWRPLNDFDRMEKFSDDEVFENEVVFKLVNTSGNDPNDVEEYQDDKPAHVLEGYDCYSIYKHQDDSYEWRLCKIVKKELKPEFKNAAAAFLDLGQRKMESFDHAAADTQRQGVGYKKALNETDKYFYILEFEHLKDYGKEMWVKRRREDVVFSAGYSRDQPNFERKCYDFIMQSYKR